MVDIIDYALKHFHDEFGPFQTELQNRCFFFQNDERKSIGTAMAWYNNNFLGQYHGRLHRVAILPKFQGRILGNPLVSLALKCLNALHEKAYLTTQTASYRAIKIYLDFGFTPFLDNETSLRAWRALAGYLHHPLLAEFE